MPTQSYNADLVRHLADAIIHHRKLYYQGKPEISDTEFDRLEIELKKIHPKHPVLQSIGTEPLFGLKAEHKTPMLSLAKTYDFDELLRWSKDKKLFASAKVDGASMSLVYCNGKLSQAKTRGNGHLGEDVTDKIQWVSSCLPQISTLETIEIRGELFCSFSNFVAISKEMQALDLAKPTSPRNIVAGVLGRKKYPELSRYFSFLAFDLLGNANLRTETQKSYQLHKLGFKLPYHETLEGQEAIAHFLTTIKAMLEEEEVGLDGAVFSYDTLADQRDLGNTSHHPRYKISYKWPGATDTTTIKSILWKTSRLGIVTPVAKITPVFLSGASISSVTLHNASHVEAYNLKPGDSIEIIRSGEVIPKFLRVVAEASGKHNFPESCESCHSLLKYDSVRLLCPNQKNCPAQQAGLLLGWIKNVGIEDLSAKRLQHLLDCKLVHQPADLYKLTPEDLLKIPLTKEKMATKLYHNIQQRKQVALIDFMAGLGIPGMGKNLWELLVTAYAEIETIRQLSIEEIISIDGFAEKTAEQLIAALQERAPIIDGLLQVGVAILPYTSTSSDQLSLDGKVFVITGTLSRPRSEIAKIIKTHGGSVTDSISNKTTALICNAANSTSSKAIKAKQLAIPIWSEAELERNIS